VQAHEVLTATAGEVAPEDAGVEEHLAAPGREGARRLRADLALGAVRLGVFPADLFERV
jgi:hypothetical protein